jgi:ADP-dependent NAD(P)H-hydrate dehydratase / NAD(P)H-hydrate epimerase
MELVTAAEMRALDRAAVKERKIPGLRLMENAGKAVVQEMERQFGRLRDRTVTVVSGKGQNGGDGFVVARLLRQRGCRTRVVLLAAASLLTGDSATTFRKYKQAGGRTHQVADEASIAGVQSLVCESEILVDAIFGTGLNAPVQGAAAVVMNLMNRSRRRTVAIDLPSGLHADSGQILGTAVQALLTVTLARPKRGLYLGDGPNVAGIIRIGDIGIPPEVIARAKIPLQLLDAVSLRAILPPRKRAAHKGSFGHAGIIAGSSGKTGAAAMAALGALRAGAGLVTVSIPEGLHGVLESKLLEAMTFPVAETASHSLAKAAKASLLGFAAAKTAVAMGPGIGCETETVGLVQELITEIKRPLVLDADGINALAGHAHILRRAQAPVILTPHPGEMARLLGTSAGDVQKDRLGVAGGFAREFNVHVVLKGAGTVIAAPDGALAVNPTGNPGMATGGTGDVLTGMIVGFLAQGLSPWDAACAGTYLHGLAGDLAAARRGEIGMIARDLVDAIPEAIRGLQSEENLD